MAKKPVVDDDDGDIVDASPSKRLVAYVLTKDISLEDAILDLVDNAVDGARRVGGKGSMAKYWVEVTFDKNRFSIADNCGGISVDLARDYAFRFGRAGDYAPLDGPKNTIGNFGVGMKRALLKMGKQIRVESRTKADFFTLEIPVDKWLADDDKTKPWTFQFATHGKAVSGVDKVGTKIEVTALRPGVADRFGLAQFAVDLKGLIEDKQSVALTAGLSISLNKAPAASEAVKVYQSKAIKPIHTSEKIALDGGIVTVSLFAGVSDKDNDLAGWNIVCNGRTILRCDTSAITGWGNKEQGDKIPNYHHQYSRFRGFVYFESDDPDLLPWNTTKTGVDVEHPLYRRFRLRMIAAMKDVFGFLDDLDKEIKQDTQPLTETLEKAKAVALTSVAASVKFVRPAAGAPAKEAQWTNIKYRRDTRSVKAVMKHLDADTPAEAGGMTFDLYLNTGIKGR